MSLHLTLVTYVAIKIKDDTLSESGKASPLDNKAPLGLQWQSSTPAWRPHFPAKTQSEAAMTVVETLGTAFGTVRLDFAEEGGRNPGAEYLVE